MVDSHPFALSTNRSHSLTRFVMTSHGFKLWRESCWVICVPERNLRPLIFPLSLSFSIYIFSFCSRIVAISLCFPTDAALRFLRLLSPFSTHHGFTETTGARPQSPYFPSAALLDFLPLSRLPPRCHPVFNLQRELIAGLPHRFSPPRHGILLLFFGAVWSSPFSTAICLMIYSFSGFLFLFFFPLFCVLPSLFTVVAVWHVFALHPINLSFNHCLQWHSNKSQSYLWNPRQGLALFSAQIWSFSS